MAYCGRRDDHPLKASTRRGLVEARRGRPPTRDEDTRTKANWKGHENLSLFLQFFLPFQLLDFFFSSLWWCSLWQRRRQYRCWSIIHGDLKDHVFSFAKSQGLKLPDTRTHHTNLTPSALLLLTAVTNDPKTRCWKNYHNSLIGFTLVKLTLAFKQSFKRMKLCAKKLIMQMRLFSEFQPMSKIRFVLLKLWSQIY